MHRRRASSLVVTVAGALIATAAVAPIATAAPKKQPPFRILVTNDDGVDSPGIDSVARALSALHGVAVTVIAPATNQTATGSKTTPAPSELVTNKTTTQSGIPATAVNGYPADAVIYALERGGMKKRPDVVISGINQTQNLGETGVEISGTVGAARVAAQRGVPALAVSLGLRHDDVRLDYTASAKEAVRWLRQHRNALVRKDGKKVKIVLENLNVPTCVTGELRGIVKVPLAPLDTPGAGDLPNCESTLVDPSTDIEAFQNGFAAISALKIPGQ